MQKDKVLSERQNYDLIFLNMLSFGVSVGNVVEDIQTSCEDIDLELRVDLGSRY